MIIYLDLVFLLNLAFDFLLLLSVKIILKRNTKLSRLILGSIVGALSIFLLFIKINSIELFAFKIIISFIMILVTFGYQNIRYYATNFLWLYIVSILLGGFLYFLNIQFSYKNQGLIFFHKGVSINVIFLLIFSPIILYIYIRQARRLKEYFNNYYEVIINCKNKSIKLTGFVDTGNKLICPYSKKPIILVSKYALKKNLSIKNPILVPYNSLNNKGILKCIKVDSLIIDNKSSNNFLIGISDEKFNIDGVDCILNIKIMEDLK